MTDNIDNHTMISYGFFHASNVAYNPYNFLGRGELRKADVLVRPNDECRPTFPNGKLNDSFVVCVEGLEYATTV